MQHSIHSLSYKRQRLGIDTRLLLTRLGELGLDLAHIVSQDDVGYRSFYPAKSVRSQLGNFTFFSQVSCVKPRGSTPGLHGVGFIGSLEKAGLRTESRPL
jgi:hypothetical protein